MPREALKDIPVVPPSGTGWRRHYRMVASRFPPVSLFEDYVDPALLEAAYQVENRTNARLRDLAGDLTRVARDDYLLGPGSTPVMAAFTHTGRESRFTDGSFGIYYAANSVRTALAEVCFHRERFMRYTLQPPNKLDQRCYSGKLLKPLHDIRAARFRHYQKPELRTYPRCQKFSARVRETGSWGLLYRSARGPGGECVALYRPPAVGIPKQGGHYCLIWDGDSVTASYEMRRVHPRPG